MTPDLGAQAYQAPASTGDGHRSKEGPPTRRTIVAAALRATTTVVVLVVLYYQLPFRGVDDVSTAVLLTVGLIVFVVLAVGHVRSILHATYPVIRAIEVLALLVPLFILVFAAAYYAMAGNDPSNFSAPLSRTDALYFTVTVFSTVGFGDIVARSEPARVAVTLQMIGDLVVIGVLIRVVITAAGHGRRGR